MSRFYIVGSDLHKSIDHLESKLFKQERPCFEEESISLKLFIDYQKMEFFVCDDNALEYSKQIIRLEFNEEAKEISFEELLKL